MSVSGRRTLKDRILDAINALIADRSLSKEGVIEALEEVESEARTWIDALQSDLKNEAQ